MRIDPHLPINRSAPTLRKSKTTGAGGGFSEILDSFALEEEPPLAETAPAVPVTAMSGILALQEVSDREASRKKLVRHSNITLDMLEDLRVSMLLGEVPLDRLQRIRAQMSNLKENVEDPELQETVRQIEIRAAVELAKYGL